MQHPVDPIKIISPHRHCLEAEIGRPSKLLARDGLLGKDEGDDEAVETQGLGEDENQDHTCEPGVGKCSLLKQLAPRVPSS